MARCAHGSQQRLLQQCDDMQVARARSLCQQCPLRPSWGRAHHPSVCVCVWSAWAACTAGSPCWCVYVLAGCVPLTSSRAMGLCPPFARSYKMVQEHGCLPQQFLAKLSSPWHPTTPHTTTTHSCALSPACSSPLCFTSVL